MGDLSGRRAVVCGSSQGIGQECAIALARAGAEVTLFARNPDTLEAVCSDLARDEGQNHSWVAADFARPEPAVVELSKKLSDRPVHILLNNSGGPPGGPILAAKPSDFLSALAPHLEMSHRLANLLVPGMKEEGYGRIINVISTSVKQPIPGLGVSNTVRGAMANWAKTLAGEVGPFGITVNNVLPGATKTTRLSSLIKSKAEKSGQTEEEVVASMKGVIPLRRFGEASEIASAVAFLAGPTAGYITGINLPVDGGRLACL